MLKFDGLQASYSAIATPFHGDVRAFFFFFSERLQSEISPVLRLRAGRREKKDIVP